MLQSRGGLRFPDKAPNHVTPLWFLPTLRRQNGLNGNLALQPSVLGQVDDAHSSSAQFTQDVIAASLSHVRLYYIRRS